MCTSRGIILIDILLAMSLATLFVVIISESTMNARDLFERSKERNRLLDIFEKTDRKDIETVDVLYGNDRIETLFRVSSPEDKSEYPYAQNIFFQEVTKLPDVDTRTFAGTPLCAVDFSSNQVPMPHIVSIALPIAASLPLTDLVVRHGTAYISTDSSTSADPDVFTIDIRNKDEPRILDSLDTGPGISSLTLVRTKLYAAAASTAAQLHVVRIEKPDNLVLEDKYQIPLPTATTTPPFASSIFYADGRVYLGTEKWNGEEFTIIDVSDDGALIERGGFETGSKVSDIYVKGSGVFVATAGEKQVLLLDVSDIDTPILRSFLSPSGWQRQEGKKLAYFEEELVLGRTSGGFNIAHDHELFAWASSSVHTNDLVSPRATRDSAGGIYGIAVDRDLIYVVTHELGKELQIFDSPFSTSTVRTFSLPVSPRTLTCDENKLYVLGQTAPVIYEISF